jgi:uncharacterized protein
MITWDEEKRKQVIDDHGVDFERIKDVFEDPYALYFEDHSHSTEDELRFDVVGATAVYGLIFATYIYTDDGGGVRVITARRAESWMVREYERNRKRL